jgi:hypothetical protein
MIPTEDTIMTMKITKLTTFWDAADAHLAIAFLDELRDRLWDTYADQIVQMYADVAEQDARQTKLTFDDEIEF